MRKFLFCIPYFFSFKPLRNASATRPATLEEPDADRIFIDEAHCRISTLRISARR